MSSHNKERSLARENILKILYQQDMTNYTLTEVLKSFVEKRVYDKSYFNNILSLIESNIDPIDKKIEKETDIILSSLPPIDRSILRLAVCEFLYREDIPKKVIMNESIKIAKKYSSDKSYKFINTILDKISKLLENNDKK